MFDASIAVFFLSIFFCLSSFSLRLTLVMSSTEIPCCTFSCKLGGVNEILYIDVRIFLAIASPFNTYLRFGGDFLLRDLNLSSISSPGLYCVAGGLRRLCLSIVRFPSLVVCACYFPDVLHVSAVFC